MTKYGVISGPYFPEFGLNTGKHGPEITPYLDTFHAVISITQKSSFKLSFLPSKKLLQRLTNQVSESCKCEIFDQIETYLD